MLENVYFKTVSESKQRGKGINLNLNQFFYQKMREFRSNEGEKRGAREQGRRAGGREMSGEHGEERGAGGKRRNAQKLFNFHIPCNPVQFFALILPKNAASENLPLYSFFTFFTLFTLFTLFSVSSLRCTNHCS